MPFKHHRHQIPLEHNATIWRYMDLEKYKSLLERQALFFCRMNKFSDPFEGSLPRKESQYRIEQDRLIAKEFGRPFDLAKAEENDKAMADTHLKFKSAVVVNCWHISNNESDAMWRLYLKDNEGVAIQSNASRIKKVVDSINIDVGMSKVRYLDFENDIWFHPQDYPHQYYNLETPFIHKRIEFIHENEFRLYHQIEAARNSEEYWNDETEPLDQNKTNKGLFVNVDLNSLIERVVLPPTIDSKAERVIKSLTGKLGYNFPFEISKLKNKPYY